MSLSRGRIDGVQYWEIIMTYSGFWFSHIVGVVALLCAPLSLQLSASVPAGPAAEVWPLFVLSVWAGLFVCATTLAVMLAGVFSFARRWRARRGEFHRASALDAWRRCSSMKLAMK